MRNLRVDQIMGKLTGNVKLDHVYLAVVTGPSGAGHVNVQEARVGDTVELVWDLTVHESESDNFETAVTVAGQIATAASEDLSASQLLIVMRRP